MWLGFAATAVMPHRMLRRAGIEMAPGSMVRSGLRVVRSGPVRVGRRSFINHDWYIDAQAPVLIGDDVLVADHVRMLPSAQEPPAGVRASPSAPRSWSSQAPGWGPA